MIFFFFFFFSSRRRHTRFSRDWSSDVCSSDLREWTELARKHDKPEADGIFLSCANTTQIEAVADVEQMLGKPVVNSNQAVLWGCVKRLKARLGPLAPMPGLGSLMRNLDA